MTGRRRDEPDRFLPDRFLPDRFLPDRLLGDRLPDRRRRDVERPLFLFDEVPDRRLLFGER